jgi:ribonucleotide reductase class II
LVSALLHSCSQQPGLHTAQWQFVYILTRQGYTFRLHGSDLIEVVTRRTPKVCRTEWKRAEDITIGDIVLLRNPVLQGFDRESTESELGWLLGSLLGDGHLAHGTAFLDYWGPTRFAMQRMSLGLLRHTVRTRSDLRGHEIPKHDKIRISSRGLAEAARRFGMSHADKYVTAGIENAPLALQAGFLSGWFDADGTMTPNQAKGVSVRLSSVSLECLYSAQRMLARLGIISRIYLNRHRPGLRLLPDGKGGKRCYPTQALHDLVISRENILVFRALVGFRDPAKAARLAKSVGAYRRKLNREPWAVRVSSLIRSRTPYLRSLTRLEDAGDLLRMHRHSG